MSKGLILDQWITDAMSWHRLIYNPRTDVISIKYFDNINSSPMRWKNCNDEICIPDFSKLNSSGEL